MEMSFVIAAPELVQDAAQNLAGIRSSLAQASSAAAGPTTGIAAAAQDEVSIAIASLFGNVGQPAAAVAAATAAPLMRPASLAPPPAAAATGAAAAPAARAPIAALA
jgi:RNA 3'-terminal phosphate cyclase